jgi:hypothetical protein
MASSMTRANAVTMFVNYYKHLNNIALYQHDAAVYQQIRESLADIMTCLTMIDDDGAYTIALTEPRVTITPYSTGARNYKVKSGQAISYTIATTLGEITTTPRVFSATDLPSWLTLNASTGVLSGTAPAISTYTNNKLTGGSDANVTDIYPTTLVSVKNDFGEATNGPYPFTFQVTHTSAPTVSSAATGTGTSGGAFTEYDITASGTPTSYVAHGLAQLGTLVVLDTATGKITGTIPATVAAGTYTIYVAAANAYGEGVDQAVVITVS